MHGRDPYDNPLIKSIDRNDAEELERLLKTGEKPDLRYAFTGWGANDTDPKILDLLVKYDAMPEGVSLSTLKFTLFAMGNSKIPIADFWDKPDLNLNGMPQKQSPITLFAKSGNVISTSTLIRKGVRARPISYLFLGVHPSHFMGCDLCDIDEFKKRISDNLAGKNDCLGKLEGQCKVAELLLSRPTKELDDVFEREKEFLFSDHRFLTLFAWAAKGDRAYLLDIHHFNKLFQLDKKSAKEAVVIAASFSSKNFLDKAIKSNLLEREDIRIAARIAAANGDNALLSILLKSHSDITGDKTTFVGQKTRKVSGVYYIESNDGPLFWAIRNNHNETVKFLLESGMSPDDCIDEYHLHDATFASNIEVMRLLISHGVDINQQDKLGNTALHEAATAGNLEAFKLLIKAGVDIGLVNSKGETALECIKNPAVLEEIRRFIETEIPVQSTDIAGAHQATIDSRPSAAAVAEDPNAPPSAEVAIFNRYGGRELLKMQKEAHGEHSLPHAAHAQEQIVLERAIQASLSDRGRPVGFKREELESKERGELLGTAAVYPLFKGTTIEDTTKIAEKAQIQDPTPTTRTA
jgi:hypothetical protein